MIGHINMDFYKSYENSPKPLQQLKSEEVMK